MPATGPSTVPGTPYAGPTSETVVSVPLQRMFAATGHASAPVTGTPAPEPPSTAIVPTVPTVPTEPTVPTVPTTTVQRAEGDGDAAAPAAASAPTSAPAAAPATAAGPAKPGTDLDELARRLYGPLTALIRAELWLDRERSGRSLAR